MIVTIPERERVAVNTVYEVVYVNRRAAFQGGQEWKLLIVNVLIEKGCRYSREGGGADSC